MDQEATAFRILGVVLVVVLVGYGVLAGQLLLGMLAALVLVAIGLAFRLVRALERIASALEADARRAADSQVRVERDARSGWDRLEDERREDLTERSRE
jgi:cobalamin biosynthesis protein CobD/CbiB